MLVDSTMTFFEISVLVALIVIYLAIVRFQVNIQSNIDATRSLQNISILLENLIEKVESLPAHLKNQEKPETYKIEESLKDIKREFNALNEYGLRKLLDFQLNEIRHSVKKMNDVLSLINSNIEGVEINTRKPKNSEYL